MMNRSESINELAGAMAKAQGVIENAAKDKQNPQFRSKYADLASCWDACREALSANGLAVLQPARAAGPEVTVTTILAHSSGQWISEELTMTSKRMVQGGGWEVIDDPQTTGKTITYARRYSLCSMVGVSPEDDDGNSGSGKGSFQPRQEPPPAQAPRGEPVQQPTNIPAELKPIFAGMRKDAKLINAAYTLMQEQLSALDGGLAYYDKVADAMAAKYPQGAGIEVHEKCILDLWEGLQSFKAAPKEPEVVR